MFIGLSRLGLRYVIYLSEDIAFLHSPKEKLYNIIDNKKDLRFIYGEYWVLS